MCTNKCNGMMVTSFSKNNFDVKLQDYIPLEINSYKKYKKWFKTNFGIKGLYNKAKLKINKK